MQHRRDTWQAGTWSSEVKFLKRFVLQITYIDYIVFIRYVIEIYINFDFDFLDQLHNVIFKITSSMNLLDL